MHCKPNPKTPGPARRHWSSKRVARALPEEVVARTKFQREKGCRMRSVWMARFRETVDTLFGRGLLPASAVYWCRRCSQILLVSSHTAKYGTGLEGIQTFIFRSDFTISSHSSIGPKDHCRLYILRVRPISSHTKP
jgi:hypothetical protein